MDTTEQKKIQKSNNKKCIKEAKKKALAKVKCRRHVVRDPLVLTPPPCKIHTFAIRLLYIAINVKNVMEAEGTVLVFLGVLEGPGG